MFAMLNACPSKKQHIVVGGRRRWWSSVVVVVVVGGGGGGRRRRWSSCSRLSMGRCVASRRCCRVLVLSSIMDCISDARHQINEHVCMNENFKGRLVS